LVKRPYFQIELADKVRAEKFLSRNRKAIAPVTVVGEGTLVILVACNRLNRSRGSLQWAYRWKSQLLLIFLCQIGWVFYSMNFVATDILLKTVFCH
jgi:hypothetical protein